MVKSKDDADGVAQGFTLEIVGLGHDEDGDAITSCIVNETGALAKPARAPSLTTREKGWLMDLTALFAEPDLAVFTVPTSGLTQQSCLTREQAREGFKRKGRFSLNPDGTLTGADRTKMSAALNALKDKKKIGLTDKHVWLIAERQ